MSVLERAGRCWAGAGMCWHVLGRCWQVLGRWWHVLALACVLVIATQALAQTPAWRIASGEVAVLCPLTVGGSFEAKTDNLTGELRVDAAQPSKLAGELSVDLRTLDTGIGLRNTH